MGGAYRAGGGGAELAQHTVVLVLIVHYGTEYNGDYIYLYRLCVCNDKNMAVTWVQAVI